jgi:hypothetical protein
MRSRVKLTRGDTDSITLSMPAGAALQSAQGIRFTARSEADDAIVWSKEVNDGITVSSDTVAVAAITTSDWDDWEAAGEPERMLFDFEVTTASGDVRTPSNGIITVEMDQSR